MSTNQLIAARDPYVDGKFVGSGTAPLVVINPATEDVVTEVATSDLEQVEEAINAARRSFANGDWANAGRVARAAAVVRMADYFEDHYETLCATVAAEVGASRAMCDGVQVRAAITQIRDLVDLYLGMPEEEHNARPLREIAGAGRVAASVIRYEPVGVVAAISAYNFPFWINMWKAIPPLLTGSSVILRPSPLTPLSALAFGEAAEAVGLPPGVLNVVIEAGLEGSRLMTTHPAVGMVTFTGSTGVGKMIAAQAAGTVKRLALELGGKSAQIYLPDVVDRAPQGCLGVFLAHAGQGCVLPTRMLVPDDRKAEVVERAAAIAAGLKVGNPADPSVQVGPVISAAQREKCERYVDMAVAAGAEVAAGGKRPADPARGFYFEPTVLDVPDNSNPAAQDEIFGPVICVLGYRDVDHAVEIANDSVFGLSAQVYSNDLPGGLAVAERLRTGAVQVNGGAFSSYACSGGYKESGIGRERGPQGIRAYQEEKHISIATL
jgi:aldehyde dehydrogenase (NAD+)